MWGAQRRGQSPWPGTDQRSEKTRIVNIVSTRQRGHERDVLTIRSAHFSHVFWWPHGANTCVAYLTLLAGLVHSSVQTCRCAEL